MYCGINQSTSEARDKYKMTDSSPSSFFASRRNVLVPISLLLCLGIWSIGLVSSWDNGLSSISRSLFFAVVPAAHTLQRGIVLVTPSSSSASPDHPFTQSSALPLNASSSSSNPGRSLKAASITITPSVLTDTRTRLPRPRPVNGVVPRQGPYQLQRAVAGGQAGSASMGGPRAVVGRVGAAVMTNAASSAVAQLPPSHQAAASGLHDPTQPMMTEHSFCHKHFDRGYVESFRPSEYCESVGDSQMTGYFTDQGHNNAEIFRLQNVRLESSSRMVVHCRRKQSVPRQPSGFSTFMYDTGMARTLGSMLHFEESIGGSQQKQCKDTGDAIYVFIKRDSLNMGHSIAEYYAFYTTLMVVYGFDISVERIRNRIHVVLLDDYDGKEEHQRIWSVFSSNPLLRKRDLREPLCIKDAIYGLPAGGSTLWRGAWEPVPCHHSKTWMRFTHMVLKHLNLLTDRATHSQVDPPRVMVIHRDCPRRCLKEEDQIVNYLKGKGARVNVVKLETMPFVEQVKAFREADLAIGVHGAAMVQAIWMQKESVAIEIITQAARAIMYRNTNKLVGHDHFMVMGQTVGGSWQDSPVSVNFDEFVKTLDAALLLVRTFDNNIGTRL